MTSREDNADRGPLDELKRTNGCSDRMLKITMVKSTFLRNL